MVIKHERLRYQKNKTSYLLALLGLLFNCLYMVKLLADPDIVPDIHVGFDVILNIVFLLFVFLGAEKLKVYNKTWCFIVAGIGVINFIRVFYLPVRLLNLEIPPILQGDFNLMALYLIASGGLLIAAAIVGYFKCLRLAEIVKAASIVEEGK